jgi:hypothetical protein
LPAEHKNIYDRAAVRISQNAAVRRGYEPAPGQSITSSSRLAVAQRLQDTTGVFTEYETAAEMFYAGDGHAHWHVSDLQSWMLAFEATPNDAVATGAKRGSCFWDN